MSQINLEIPRYSNLLYATAYVLPAGIHNFASPHASHTAPQGAGGHIPTWLFKQSADLSKQQKAIVQILSDINPINTGKKRDEARALPAKFFPKAETHMGQMKKYKSTIDYLAQGNTERKKEVESRKPSINKQIEAIARCIMPDILAFYESEDGQKEFAERKHQQEAEKNGVEGNPKD